MKLYFSLINIDFHVCIVSISIDEDISTASKLRIRFWIIKLLKMVKSIRYNCVICKKPDKKLSEQIMGKLPVDRLKPSPAWTCTAIDLFGPFKIRDEVKKRTTGKTYGVISISFPELRSP